MHARSRSPAKNTASNSNHRRDVQDTLEMCQWILKPIGVWPLVYDHTSRLQKIVSIVLIMWCVFVLMFSLIPPGRYIFFKEKNFYKKMKLIGPIGFTFASGIKYAYLCLKGTIFKRCIVHLKEDWKTVDEANHRAIMIKQANISKNLIAMCIVFIYTGGMSFTTVMPFVSKASHKGNVTIRPLVYPGYDEFFDTQATPTYEIIFTIHCFCSFIKYTVTTGAYSLTATFVTHICGQIQIQKAQLDEMVREKGKGYGSLDLVIQEHMETMRLSKDVEYALCEICFMEIVESTLFICLLGYCCLMEWQNSDAVAIMTFFVLLVSFIFNIFIFCYVGQTLTDQCIEIGPAFYDIDWYNMPPAKARYVILLNVISLYPPKLTGGKMFELNLITFSSVLQSSVVYLNLLRTVAEQ